MITKVFPIFNNIKMNMVSPPEGKYIPRALVYSFLIIMQLPFHWLELIFFKRKIESHQLKEDPIFILGYWRSGTTYLQRLLCSNSEVAFLTLYEAFFPLGSGIHTRLFKPLINTLFKTLKIKHPSHGVYLDMDFPSEEDIALCSSSYPHTPMWAHIYSRRANYYFDKLLIAEESSEISESFIKMYKYMVKKLSYFKHGRKLVLKTPSNTAKVAEILKAFPNSKFIYIKRKREDVYFSNMKLLSNNRHQWLQAMSEQQMTRIFISSYPKVIGQYYKTKKLIPEGNLIEVDFDELCRDPQKSLCEIYSKFDIRQTDADKRIMYKFLEENHLKQVNHYVGQVPKKVKNMFDEFHKY